MFPYWIDRYGRKKRETNVQQTNKEKTMKKKMKNGNISTYHEAPSEE